MTATDNTLQDDPYRLAIAQWQSRAVPLLPPPTNHEIETAFARLRHPLSDDIRRLYSATGGFADYECDCVWSLWSLDRLVRENQNRDSEFLWFADFLISSHMYAFRYHNDEASVIYIDHNIPQHPPTQVAKDVPDFLRKYIDDPDSVEAWNLDG